jgi:hypothetical protein
MNFAMTTVTTTATEPGRAVLLAAAAYNALWGLTAIAVPRRLARIVGFDDSGDGTGWRAAGVVILAYAPAYVWAARDSTVAPPIVATAILGKSIGALGWLAGLATGRFPRRTLLLPLFNDIVWLPGLARLLARR